MATASFRAMTGRADLRRHAKGEPALPLRPLLILAALVLAAPADAGAPSPSWPLLWPEPTPRAGPTLHPDRAMELTAREVGQMIMIGFPGSEPGEAWPARAAAMIAEGRIGGVILFADNARNPAQVGRLTGSLAAAAGALPPFIAIDQEGGYIQRLTRRHGFQSLPSARAIARTDLCTARADYAKTATELAALGIDVNFGPVVDLNINPRNPAIGRKARSYGTDAQTVVAYAEQFIAAHDDAGVLTAAKHFPGHGSAVLDPHKRIVDITKTWQPRELTPFRVLAREQRVPMIMVGHLIHPRFSDGDRPASLSRRAITVALRKELGFDGLVVTDDLGMDAIADRYSEEAAAVMAARAGADILLFANRQTSDASRVDRVIDAVTGAVAAGRIPAATIDQSYQRILATKRALADAIVHRHPAPAFDVASRTYVAAAAAPAAFTRGSAGIPMPDCPAAPAAGTPE